jgi:hypothetical protein
LGGQLCKQLLLSGDGFRPAVHWQIRDAGSALVETLMALATQEQWLDPGSMVLLRVGHGRHEPESPIDGLYFEGEQGRHWAVVSTLKRPTSHPHPWFPTSAFAWPTPQATQLVLSGDGSNPAKH